MKSAYIWFLLVLSSGALEASSSPVVLRPNGGPLSRINNYFNSDSESSTINKTITDLVNNASVPSLSLLWSSNLSTINPSDIKYYRTFLTELFSLKLSVLMDAAVAAADETATKPVIDQTSILNASTTSILPAILSKNVNLSRYIRSFNTKYNPNGPIVSGAVLPSTGQLPNQALTNLDTFAGVIVINQLTAGSGVVFGPALQDVGQNPYTYASITYPNTPVITPDYNQISGYDAAVFSTFGAAPGQVKFIPAPDFTDSWYDHLNVTNPEGVNVALRAIWYVTGTGATADANSNGSNTNSLTIDGSNYGYWTCLSVTADPGSAIPIITLYQNNYNATAYKILYDEPAANSMYPGIGAANNAAMESFFNNDPYMQWAPVILIKDDGKGQNTGTIDIVGLVKLNPYYFPLYYSGAVLQEGQLNQTYNTNSTVGPVGPVGIGTYTNGITGVPYFSERRIFDSITNLYTTVAALPFMPEVNQQINGANITFPLVTYNGKNVTSVNSSSFTFDSNLQLNFNQSGPGWSCPWEMSKSTGSVNQKTNMNLQNFGLAKFVGLLQYDSVYNDPTNVLLTDATQSNPASYENLFFQSRAALQKYYILPGHLSSPSVLQNILANPSNSTSGTLNNKTDVYMPATSSYVPAVSVLTVYYDPNVITPTNN